MKMILGILLIVGLMRTATCVLGVDVAGLFSTSTFQCMKNSGYRFAIIRGFHSYGAIDT